MLFLYGLEISIKIHKRKRNLYYSFGMAQIVKLLSSIIHVSWLNSIVNDLKKISKD